MDTTRCGVRCWYLLLFGLLAGGAITGLLLARAPAGDVLWLAATPGWLGWTLPEWHAGLAQAITGFVAAHVASVFLHDARGTTGEIWAMVNGHKTFILPPVPPEASLGYGPWNLGVRFS